MLILSDLKYELAGFMDDALFADGFDDAIIGYVQRCGMMVVLYDARKCIEILMNDGIETEEDAIDFFEYNVLNAWVGENTPAFAYLEDYL